MKPSRTLVRAFTLIALGSAIVLGERSEDSAVKASAPLRPAPPLAEPYKILLTRCLFSRDHRAAAVVHPAAGPSVAITAPNADQSDFVLRGIMAEDDAFAAYFEQNSTGQVIRVIPGASISHGVVRGITMDGVDYAVDGHVTRVLCGRGLEGGVAIAATPDAAAQPGGAAIAQNVPNGQPTSTGDKWAKWRKSRNKDRSPEGKKPGESGDSR